MTRNRFPNLKFSRIEDIPSKFSITADVHISEEEVVAFGGGKNFQEIMIETGKGKTVNLADIISAHQMNYAKLKITVEKIRNIAKGGRPRKDAK